MKVAIAGATGFIGSRLVQMLHEQGDAIVVLTRDAKHAWRVFPERAFPNVQVVEYVPTDSGNWQQSLSGCNAVVNLAGTAIAAERWTPERKQLIYDSRVHTTERIVEGIANAELKPSVLINASAIGYYGTSETATFEEASAPGNDFLASVCQDWEAAARKVEAACVRLAIVRFGIVLGNGGAIAKLLTPFRLFAGGPLGSGHQWFSWIHRDDLVRFLIEAIARPDLSGVFNGTAPNPVRMSELCDTLGTVLKRPSWLPVPGFALEMLLGDAAKVVLEGQEVLPRNIEASGFEYRYPQLEPALQEIVAQS
ncbi:putative nucleoside-diphosphate sugar epimerase [Rubidibacter lacunae KORDI 51-2]|uniref:Putative nucleoside-diphosphate sugar epimerase n=1 Tax=Rubidibacter lacunae KORDI 51-2 TaxID=582515 RepID=U5DCC9_9CHRO|nr:TIGR01777 family oxidoreductase [Rubidibacter lacunae]ERN42188.1 putative nucleoside-diphosphate sugar epimerase [Rubidibacter lacunae KORDI 51-2]